MSNLIRPFNTKKIDVVINYFNPKKDAGIISTTLKCVRIYSSDPLCHVILSDGSGFKEEELDFCSKVEGFDYLWSSTPLSFSETYNRGIEWSEQRGSDYVCLSANDILVNSSTMSLLLSQLQADRSVGCVIPYLSWSDFMIQNDKWLKRKRYTYGMSLNVNLFRTQELAAIGKVPIELSGCFNDIVMSAKIRKLGKKILLCDAGQILHITKMTVSVASSVNYHQDKENLKKYYPNLISKNYLDYVRISELCEVNKLLKVYYLFLDRCDKPLLIKFLHLIGRIGMRLEKIIWQSIFSWLPNNFQGAAEKFLMNVF